jgi:ketosteroid isomerase-like protein
MSQENVEIVERIYEAWREAGSPLESGLLSPDIEWANPKEAVEPGTRRGIESFDAAVRSVADTFDARVEFEEFIDAGDKVLVIGTLHGAGRGSGAEVRRRQGYVWTIRDGKAVRFEWFNDPDVARRAAGI